MAHGHIAMILGDHRLYAKLLAIDAQGCDVEYFLSVAARQRARHPRTAVKHACLQPQTRVFVQQEAGNWKVGRVREAMRDPDGSFTYGVRFPNGKDMDVHESQLFVRCLDEFADPADILAAGCAETQFFADRRRRAIKRLTGLKAAAQGLTGLVSSGIELVPHQVAAARRALTDPTLRYLLADEVGLGKTIEAGVIIRQLLIDQTVQKVVILVPDNLVQQWRLELLLRFGVDDFEEAEVDVVPFSRLSTIERINALDLLVVDEAHTVVARDREASPCDVEFIRDLATNSTRLLLLSATPVLANEEQFLGMLNLLDSSAFPLDKPEEFHRKVENRQEIGRFLLAFKPGVHSLILKQSAQRSSSIFPGDETVARLCQQLLESLQRREDPAQLVNEIRDHIARTYRVHHRVIRARRSDIEGWALWPRGPRFNASVGELPNLQHVHLDFDRDRRNIDIWNAIEAWRDAALRTAEEKPDLRAALVERCLQLHMWAGSGAIAFQQHVAMLSTLFADEQQYLELPPTFSDQSDLRLKSIETALMDWKSQYSANKGDRLRKLCCFCSDPDDATRLASHLQRTIGFGYVASLAACGEAAHEVVVKFESDPMQWVLVCDSSAQEGLNLQFAHTIFHADLPLDASRLEQRIGRLDRFGRRINGVWHRVLLPVEDDNSPWRAWFRLLATSLAIFNQSISDVQFLLEGLQADIAAALFAGGAAGVAGLHDRIRDELRLERVRLDEQSALDSLALLQDSGQELTNAIEESEEDEEAIADDFHVWMKVFNFQQLRNASESDVVRYSWTDTTLLPSIPWRQLIEPAFARQSTWKRYRSLRSGRKPITLLRPGSAMLQALERISRWDDRGIAYATWRIEPERQVTWRGFRLIWLVEPSVDNESPIYRRDAHPELRRRAEALLAPKLHEQVFDELGREVTDQEILDSVRRPYDQREDSAGRRDINLGSRSEELRSEIDLTLLAGLTRSVRAVAEQSLLGSAALQENVDKASAACDLQRARVRAAIDAHRGSDLAERDRSPQWLLDERELLETLSAAVRRPRLRLDEIGFVVLSAQPPTRAG